MRRQAIYLKKILGFDGSCKESGEGEVIAGYIMWLAQIIAWIAAIVDFSTKRKKPGGCPQKLYSDSGGIYLLMAVERRKRKIRGRAYFGREHTLVWPWIKTIFNKFASQYTKNALASGSKRVWKLLSDTLGGRAASLFALYETKKLNGP